MRINGQNTDIKTEILEVDIADFIDGLIKAHKGAYFGEEHGHEGAKQFIVQYLKERGKSNDISTAYSEVDRGYIELLLENPKAIENHELYKTLADNKLVNDFLQELNGLKDTRLIGYDNAYEIWQKIEVTDEEQDRLVPKLRLNKRFENLSDEDLNRIILKDKRSQYFTFNIQCNVERDDHGVKVSKENDDGQNAIWYGGATHSADFTDPKIIENHPEWAGRGEYTGINKKLGVPSIDIVQSDTHIGLAKGDGYANDYVLYLPEKMPEKFTLKNLQDLVNKSQKEAEIRESGINDEGLKQAADALNKLDNAGVKAKDVVPTDGRFKESLQDTNPQSVEKGTVKDKEAIIR